MEDYILKPRDNIHDQDNKVAIDIDVEQDTKVDTGADNDIDAKKYDIDEKAHERECKRYKGEYTWQHFIDEFAVHEKRVSMLVALKELIPYIHPYDPDYKRYCKMYGLEP